MNRLLQGDVGSGKTIVSMAAMITACENSYQAAIMAPTEILAQTAFQKLSILGEKIWGLNAVLLIGSINTAQKKEARGFKTAKRISSSAHTL
jgi:ATP-dependent DNA helicase RecG